MTRKTRKNQQIPRTMRLKTLLNTSLLTAAIFAMWPLTSMGQAYTFTSGNLTYSENFDEMGSAGTTFPTGWNAIRISGTGTANADLTLAVTDGSANSGGVYNVGTSDATDRSLGSLGSGTTVPAYGASLKNSSGSTLSSIAFSFVVEQWRSGSSNTVNEKNIFEYSLDATSLSTGTWVPVSTLDLNEILTSTTTAAAVDGNLPANQTSVSGSITGLSLADGATIWFRWSDTNDAGSDGILAIDNLTITGESLVDNTAPVATFIPNNNATNVDLNTIPTITFDEAIRNIDNSDITDANVASLLVLKETDDAGTDVPFTATIDADKKVITVTPTATLAFNQLYYFAVNPVEDASDNPTVLEAVTFTTRAASTVATVSSTAYTVDNTAETIVGIPFSATLANFKANLTPAEGASFEVYESDGSTVATDLATGYKVIVTAEDGTTTKTYTVTVNTSASTEANITSFTVASVTGTIDGSAHTVAVTVPFGTDVTALVPTITLSAGATVDPASGVAQDFTSPVTYTVTAEDGTTTQPWVVTVTVAPAPAPAFTATYPMSANIGSDQFDVVVNLDAAGKVYFQQVASGAAAPTSADLKANGTAIDVTAAATDYSATITGLTSSTAYDVYFVTENATGDVLMATPVKLSVTTTAGTITIHDIQYTADASGDSPYKDQEVTTSGIVTAIKLSSTTGAQQAFYIQDGTGAWNGIYVYSATPAVALGDNVTVTGTVAEYNNLTEISPVSSAVVESQNNPLPDPAVITTQEANTEAYEGVLVTVQNVNCVSGSAGTFVVNDGSGDLTAYKSIFADFALNINSHYNITGVMTWFSIASLYELYPRDINDVTLLTGISQNKSVATKAFPNPFSDNFTVNSTKVVSTISIYNLLGQKLVEHNYSATEVTVPAANLSNGIYIVNVRFQDGTAATLRMVKK